MSMMKTEITFEDIREGDFIEAASIENGVRIARTGVASHYKPPRTVGVSELPATWFAKIGGAIVRNRSELLSIYRLKEVVEFAALQGGERLRVTTVVQGGDTTVVVTGTAFKKVYTPSSGSSWTTSDGVVLCTYGKEGQIIEVL